MDMQQVTRVSLIVLLTAGMPRGLRAADDSSASVPVAKPVAESTTASGKAPVGPAEYKRTDQNFYPKAELLKIRPDAVILSKDRYEEHDGSYYFTPKVRAPKEVFIENVSDWIEPITPPDMPPSLGVPPDAMQIREPQGDVQVALPSAPASFSPVTDNMTLPNGAVVKTGADGTAAVLFGGVDSARLMPNSAAAMQQTVTVNSRSVEVDLTSGGVFSKVGTQVGVKGSYEVHTPSGNAGAAGGDFVTIIVPSEVPHTDVWVAQGTVAFEIDGKPAGSVTSDGTGALKLLRSVAIANPNQAVQADSQTLSDAMNFIPLANQKLKALREKQAAGTALSANEQAYLGRIKQVPSLIKLDLVPPPAPVAATPPPAEPVAPAVPPPLSHDELVAFAKDTTPIILSIDANGQISSGGTTVSMDDLRLSLAAAARANPTVPVIIVSDLKSPREELRKVGAASRRLKLPTKVLQPGQVVNTADSTGAPLPSPELPKPVAVATEKPLNVNIHADGTIGFRGAKMDLPTFQGKITDIGKVTPDQAFVLHAGSDVTDDKIQPVVDSFKTAGLEKVTMAPRPVVKTPEVVTPPAPAPTPAPEAPAVATETPAPTPAPAETPAAPPTAPEAPKAVATKKPLSVNIHADGTVGFRGKSMPLADFQAKLAEIGKATPDQAFNVHAAADATDDKIQPVMDSFHAAGLEHATLAPRPVAATPPPPTPAPAPAVESTAPSNAVATPPTSPEAPAPAISANVPAPHLALPPDTTAPETPSASSPAATGPNAMIVTARNDGRIRFRGETMDLSTFQSKVADIAKTSTDGMYIVRAAPTVPQKNVQAIIDAFHAANISGLTVNGAVVGGGGDVHTTPDTTSAPAPAATPAAPAPETPAPAIAADVPAPHLSVPGAPDAAPETPKAVATKKPLSVNIHSDGTVGFRGSKMELSAFQAKLAEIGKATPDQAFLLHAPSDVTDDKIQPVMDSFHAAGLEKVEMAPRASPKPTKEEAAAAEKSVAAVPVAEPVDASDKAPKAKPVSDDDVPTLKVTAPKVENVGGPSVEVRLHSNGRMEYQDESVTLDQLKAKLSTLDAGRMVILEQDEKTEQIDSDKVIEIITDLKLKSKILKVPESEPVVYPDKEGPKVGA
jgi:biopolymer transport protein ExbD